MPEPAMLDYFYGDEAEQYTFYRIPKVLFCDLSTPRGDGSFADLKTRYGELWGAFGSLLSKLEDL